MPKEEQLNQNPTQPPVAPQPVELKSNGLTKHILFGLLGLAFVSGAAYAGYWYGTQRAQYPGKPTSVSQPAPKPATPPIEDQTKDWKTYINGEFGYQIKYPGSWNIKEEQLQALALLSTMISSPTGNSLIDIWVRKGTWEQVKGSSEAKDFSETTLNGIEALVDNADDNIVFTLPSRREGQIIQIIYWPSAESVEETSVTEQILSTFQLLD